MLKRGRELRISRAWDRRSTIMELTGPPVRLVLRIEARLSARQRRLLAVTFFRQIRPWLEYFSSSSLHHLEDHWLTVQREKVRPVRDFGRAAIDEPGGVS